MRVVSRTLLMTAAVWTTAAVHVQQHSLPDVLRLAGQYALAYEQKFSLLVAEEHYEQQSIRNTGSLGRSAARPDPGGGVNSVEQRRVLKSDYLLVRLDGGGWMPFRDVFEVDGRPQRDRGDRVLNLFLKPGAGNVEQAQRIMQDSTRFNLGAVQRTINIPTLAVLFAQPSLASRFEYARAGEETVDGRNTWVLSYKETRRPTLIKSSKGKDLPLTGRLWVDPATGVILKTYLVAADADVRAVVTVTFREDPRLDLWVPARMEEAYATKGSEEIVCTAAYTNYRRFYVATDEAIRKPPG